MEYDERSDTGTFIPTFPNAKYLFNKEEFNHWQEIVASGGGSQSTTDQAIMGECVQPIVDSNLHELIDSSYIIANEGDKCCIYLISTPGHTPGHCSVVIESNGARGVITGDCILILYKYKKHQGHLILIQMKQLVHKHVKHYLDH